MPMGTVHGTVGSQFANARALYTLRSMLLVLSTMAIIFIPMHASTYTFTCTYTVSA